MRCAGVEHMDKGVFGDRCVLRGGGARLVMRGELAGVGWRGGGCGLWGCGLRRGTVIVRAPLVWRGGVAFHAYALIAGFHGAGPIIFASGVLVE